MKVAQAAIATILLLAPVPAFAWETTLDTDPMTDEATAYTFEANEGASVLSAVILGFKCWQRKPDDTLLIIGTTTDWDPSAKYAETIDVKVRVDKNDPIPLSVIPSETGGKFGATINSRLQPDLLKFLGQVRGAKKQIALSMNDIALRFPVKGSTKTVDKLVSTCGITLPKAD